MTFTVTASNAGPDDATAVEVTDVLPAGLTFVSATPSQGTYDRGDRVCGCRDDRRRRRRRRSLVATVASPDPQTNTATVTDADQADPNTANNTAEVTVTPQQADLALTKTVSRCDTECR